MQVWHQLRCPYERIFVKSARLENYCARQMSYTWYYFPPLMESLHVRIICAKQLKTCHGNLFTA